MARDSRVWGRIYPHKATNAARGLGCEEAVLRSVSRDGGRQFGCL
jgi:hypothetical protein